MSYPKDLDEYTTKELQDELERRRQHRCIGLCDYCGQKAQSKPACRFPARHNYIDPSLPYIEEYWCPFCQKETLQTIIDSQHERDSSGDSRECTVCEAIYSGYGGKYYLDGLARSPMEGHI